MGSLKTTISDNHNL